MKPVQQPGSSWLDPDIVESLDGALSSPCAGDAELFARVRRRVMDVVRAESNDGHHTVRASEEGWERIAPNVARKTLWASGGAHSCLLRLDAGAVVEAHLHPEDEECIVLQGSIRIGNDLVLRAGDFHIGLKGSAHQVTTSATGALVYLRAAAAQA
jgi:quercetin dioxygenase-like cupin family protein